MNEQNFRRKSKRCAL